MNHYHINIFHSEKYKGYIADIPDLPDCNSLGNTPAEALAAVEKMRDSWLEGAGMEHLPIPKPRYRPPEYKEFLLTSDFSTESGDEKDQPSYDSALEYIADRISKHECILFLGSAIHVPPPPMTGTAYTYNEQKAPPVGTKLAKHLAEKAKYPGQDWWNLQRVAQHFETETKSRFRLIEEIRTAVDVGHEPSPMLRLLADLKFPIVITTNYDSFYERALDERAHDKGLPQQEYQVSIYSPNNNANKRKRQKTLDCPKDPQPDHPFILKIHGDLNHWETIVITDEDYIQFVLRMGDKKPFYPFGDNVLTRLTTWPTLFIGYSLMDYNLRLLFKTLRWKLDNAQIPPNYSVDKKPDELIRDVWENQRRYVNFIVLNLWDFIPKLHTRVSSIISTQPSSTSP